MTNNEVKREAISEEISQRAVSIYGPNDTPDDFPVLKAFQQYIDAEQEKARRRMMTLSIVFGAVLLLVVTGAVAVLMIVVARNQRLNDQLISYAMSETTRHQTTPVPSPSPAVQPQNDAALKAMAETLVTLQKQLQEKRQTVTDDSDKISTAKKFLEIEKQKLAVEKERLHQIEIDQQRRKLYPELYDEEDGAAKYSNRLRPESVKRNRTLTDEDIREIIREAYSESEKPNVSTENNLKNKSAEKEAKKPSPDGNLTEDEAVEYFKDDEFLIPIEGKESSSKVRFSVPLE